MNISDRSEKREARSENSCELRVASCENTEQLADIDDSNALTNSCGSTSLASRFSPLASQLEWATRKDSAEPMPSDLSESQIQELESLEKAWSWFGNMLENATDDDFRPTASPNPTQTTKSTSVPTASPKRHRLLYVFSASVAVLVMVCGVILVNGFIHQPTDSTPIAKNQPVDIINTDADTSVQDKLAWEEDDAYDDELEALSNSMLNAAPGGTWEMSAMAECSVVGYEMSEWNSTF